MYLKAVKAIENAKYIVISTGAGMGIDSGLPDFRGNQGFWNNYPPYKNKFNFFECANPDFLRTNPDLFWGFYGHRLNMYRQKKPHDGYNILINLAKTKKGYFGFTSNVDGHLNQFFGERVYEVHGSIHYIQCICCGILQKNTFQPKINIEEMKCENIPKCHRCGHYTRPNILMFGDYDWDSTRSDQQSQRYQQFLNQVQSDLVMIEIGAGKTVSTIRNMNQHLLYKLKDSTLIRINPEQQSFHSDRIVHIQQKALKALKELKKGLE